MYDSSVSFRVGQLDLLHQPVLVDKTEECCSSCSRSSLRLQVALATQQASKLLHNAMYEPVMQTPRLLEGLPVDQTLSALLSYSIAIWHDDLCHESLRCCHAGA